MQNLSIEDDRNVIPRWRSPIVADSWEIAAARDIGNTPLLDTMFADELGLWRAEGTVAAAVDIYDTGILLSDKKLQAEGMGPILRNSSQVPPPLIYDIRRSLAKEESLPVRRMRLSRFESNEAYRRRTIALLKRRAVEHPRDVLNLLETARLYVLSGQGVNAERYIQRALYLAPNNRLVLRSATQYYKLVGDLNEILPALRTNDVGRYDPLIQSSEIAASDLAGRGSRFASAALKNLKGLRDVSLRQSELALAVATIEYGAGTAQRRVFQMVRAGIAHGTENAQAQAVWLGEQAERPLGALMPTLQLSDNAYEAKALALFEGERYAEAAQQTILWLQDQPFEPDAICLLCNCYAVYLHNAGDALPFARSARVLHADNWAVQNAILLVFVGSGNLVEAAETLNILNRLSTTQIIQAYYYAGLGMFLYAKQDTIKGAENYTRAIDSASGAKRPDLVFSASVFWIYSAFLANSLSSEMLESLRPEILSSLKIIGGSDRDYAAKLWKVVDSQMTFTSSDHNSVDHSGSASAIARVIKTIPAVIERLS